MSVPVMLTVGTSSVTDPYDLNRFLRGQDRNYEQALTELRAGEKRSHWMWYIFPQYSGLSFSLISQHYAISSIKEAKTYLSDPILGPRLLECAEALMQIQDRTAQEILGEPDDMKLQACATLFAQVSTPGSIFERLLEKYFEGESHRDTLELLERAAPSTPTSDGPPQMTSSQSL